MTYQIIHLKTKDAALSSLTNSDKEMVVYILVLTATNVFGSMGLSVISAVKIYWLCIYVKRSLQIYLISFYNYKGAVFSLPVLVAGLFCTANNWSRFFMSFFVEIN